ncbi:MAG TPA: SDR family oxidoreductase [Acidimicrobiales bacterium]|nr:SDR family oxidoreductase [Acidimicrobiales bacterium]
MSRFEGKVAVLTGAASGIGRATSQRFAAEGATVIGVDVNTDGLAETAALVDAAGGSFEGRGADITDRSACFDLIDGVITDHGGIDVLANIAGVTRIQHFTDATEHEIELMMAVNAKGPMFLCQAAIPHLIDRVGNIVNVASNAGLMGAAYTVAYCASKGAIVQLTRALAIEYEKTPLRVNAVAPGGVKTPMTEQIPMPADIDFDLLAGVMSKRGRARPEDIAGVIAFIASDDASRMNGSIVSVDDGLVAG